MIYLLGFFIVVAAAEAVAGPRLRKEFGDFIVICGAGGLLFVGSKRGCGALVEEPKRSVV